MNNILDIVIVGGGAAGLTAGMYAVRRGMNVTVISKDVGGQASTTDEIENYPGIEFIAGRPLMDTMLKQATDFGCNFVTDDVLKIEKKDDIFEITLSHSHLQARSVLLAFGLTPRDINVAHENEYKGESLFYGLPHDYDQRDWKKVAVIGGGNSALGSALQLAKVVDNVCLVHRRDEFRADQKVIDDVKNESKISLHTPYSPIALEGGDKLEQIILKNNKDESEHGLMVDAVIVHAGFEAKTDIVGDLVDRNDKGEIIVTKHNHTKTSGLFAAGDVTELSYKQLPVSVGEGAKAALEAVQYVSNQTGVKPLPDWGLQPKK